MRSRIGLASAANISTRSSPVGCGLVTMPLTCQNFLTCETVACAWTRLSSGTAVGAAICVRGRGAAVCRPGHRSDGACCLDGDERCLLCARGLRGERLEPVVERHEHRQPVAVRALV